MRIGLQTLYTTFLLSYRPILVVCVRRVLRQKTPDLDKKMLIVADKH